jgi:putrescine importer
VTQNYNNRAGECTPPTSTLTRVLTLWDLIFYGMVLIQPIAPIPLFGVAQSLSRGHIVDTIILAMFAMMITAFSYGRMASLYPSAGSAYTYVGRGLNPHIGFFAGWAMILDYLLQPILNAIWVSVGIHRLVPTLPFAAAAVLFLGLVVGLNLAGIRATAKANKAILAIMCIVVAMFFVLSIRYLAGTQGWAGIISTKPFYNPKTFSFPVIGSATSLAALTYIGFDGVTTLAEDVVDPKRNVLLATVLVCLFTGLLSSAEVYLAQQVWPDYNTFPNLVTAFWDVCKRVGGMVLFGGMTAVTLVACFGSALTGTLGAGRLLYGMGRDNVLPRKFFGHLSRRNKVPTYNILAIGFVALIATLLLDYAEAAELLNFGAFLAFMGVNLATVRQYYVIGQPAHTRSLLKDGILPSLGFLFCLWIWWGLRMPAKVVGAAWLSVGLVYAAVTTRGFREEPLAIDFIDRDPGDR